MIISDVMIYIIFMTGVVISDIRKYRIPLLNVYLAFFILLLYRLFIFRRDSGNYIAAAFFSFAFLFAVFVFSRGRFIGVMGITSVASIAGDEKDFN